MKKDQELWISRKEKEALRKAEKTKMTKAHEIKKALKKQDY